MISCGAAVPPRVARLPARKRLGVAFVAVLAINLVLGGYSIWFTHDTLNRNTELLRSCMQMRDLVAALYVKLSALPADAAYDARSLRPAVDADLVIVDSALAKLNRSRSAFWGATDEYLRSDFEELQRRLQDWKTALQRSDFTHGKAVDIGHLNGVLEVNQRVSRHLLDAIQSANRILTLVDAAAVALLTACLFLISATMHRSQRGTEVRNRDLERQVSERNRNLEQALQDNQRQLETLRAMNARAELLNEAQLRLTEASRLLFETGDHRAFHERVIEDLKKLTGACYGSFGVFDREGSLVEFVTAREPGKEHACVGSLPREQELLERFYHERRLIREADVDCDPHCHGMPSTHQPMRGLLGAPIMSNDMVKGVIYLAGVSARQFSQDDELVLGIYTKELAHVLERNDLLQALRRDNAERVQAQRSLAEARARLQSLIDNSPGVIYTLDPKSYAVTFISDNVQRVFNTRPESVLGDPQAWMSRTHPEDVPVVLEGIAAILRRNEVSIEGRFLDGKGEYRWVRASSRVVRDAADEPVELLGVVMDITELKLAEKAAKESERTAQSSLDALSARIAILDENGCILAVNSAWGQHASAPWEREADSTVGSNYLSLLSKAGTAHATEAERGIRDVMERRRADFYMEYSCCESPLEEWYALRVTRYEKGDETRVVLAHEDISERRRAEEKIRQQRDQLQLTNKRLEEAHNQLLQSEKMAAIGQLAAGVAHEINNPVGYINSNLAALNGYISDLVRVVDTYAGIEPLLDSQPQALQEIRRIKSEVDLEFVKQDIASLLKESQEGVTRVRQIVKDLKDFSHVDDEDWAWADVREGLESTLNIVHNEIKYKAQVIREFRDIPQIECRLHQLNQVFMNMLVNAAHAIEDRGRIFVRTRAEGEWICIEIEDTGKGIPSENLNRIFDPFFTTKPVGKGTGLGLSLSYGIVDKHGGRIEVESTLGKGTCFRIWLPQRRTATA